MPFGRYHIGRLKVNELPATQCVQGVFPNFLHRSLKESHAFTMYCVKSFSEIFQHRSLKDFNRHYHGRSPW